MAKQIIQQPNGLYCLFSSVVDHVTDYHLDREQIIDCFLEDARQDVVARVDHILERLADGKRPYFQFTKTYDEMLEAIMRAHGLEERAVVTGYTESELSYGNAAPVCSGRPGDSIDVW